MISVRAIIHTQYSTSIGNGLSQR